MMISPATMEANASGNNENPLSALIMRMLLNLYPPYLGTGIRVSQVAADWRRIRVEMKLRFYNRNYVGTHFGGSLSAMTDPFYMLMLLRNLGPGFIVWDRFGTIDYRKPGRGRVAAEFRIDAEMLEEIRFVTADGSRCYREFAVDVVDEEGDVVAHVTRTLYIRRKHRSRAAPVSA